MNNEQGVSNGEMADTRLCTRTSMPPDLVWQRSGVLAGDGAGAALLQEAAAARERNDLRAYQYHLQRAAQLLCAQCDPFAPQDVRRLFALGRGRRGDEDTQRDDATPKALQHRWLDSAAVGRALTCTVDTADYAAEPKADWFSPVLGETRTDVLLAKLARLREAQKAAAGGDDDE